MTAEELLASEKERGAQIDRLTAEDPQAALEFVVKLLQENEPLFGPARAPSACLARLTSRFLMHRKNKDHMVGFIADNEYLRTVYFGRLNTYKYSLVFVAKRVMRKGDARLSAELIGLIKNNPFRDDTAESYSERFSWDFIRQKIIASQEEYLKLSDEILALLKE